MNSTWKQSIKTCARKFGNIEIIDCVKFEVAMKVEPNTWSYPIDPPFSQNQLVVYKFGNTMK